MYTDFLSRLKYHSQRTIIESKYGRANKVAVQRFGQFLCRKGLVVCDPSALVSAQPFAHRVDSGMYTVWGLVLTIPRKGQRTALAWVTPSTENCVVHGIKTWEPALVEKATPPGNTVSTDSGVVAFCNDEAPKKYATAKKHYEKLLSAMEMPVPGHPFRSPSGAVVGSLSGMGDGTYPCFWGHSERGISQLLIDFLMIDFERLRLKYRAKDDRRLFVYD